MQFFEYVPAMQGDRNDTRKRRVTHKPVLMRLTVLGYLRNRDINETQESHI